MNVKQTVRRADSFANKRRLKIAFAKCVSSTLLYSWHPVVFEIHKYKTPIKVSTIENLHWYTSIWYTS